MEKSQNEVLRWSFLFKLREGSFPVEKEVTLGFRPSRFPPPGGGVLWLGLWHPYTRAENQVLNL